MSIEEIVEPPTGIYQERRLRATTPDDMKALLRAAAGHAAAGIDPRVEQLERAATAILERHTVNAWTGRFVKRRPVLADMPAIEAWRRGVLLRQAVTGKVRDAVDILNEITALRRFRSAGDTRGVERAVFNLGATGERLQVRSAEPFAMRGRKQSADGQHAGRRKRVVTNDVAARIHDLVALARQANPHLTREVIYDRVASRLAGEGIHVSPRTVRRYAQLHNSCK